MTVRLVLRVILVLVIRVVLPVVLTADISTLSIKYNRCSITGIAPTYSTPSYRSEKGCGLLALRLILDDMEYYRLLYSQLCFSAKNTTFYGISSVDSQYDIQKYNLKIWCHIFLAKQQRKMSAATYKPALVRMMNFLDSPVPPYTKDTAFTV